MNTSLDSIAFEGIAAIRDRLLAKPHPLRLESGDPSFATPEHIQEAARHALKNGQTHYASSTGIGPLREAIVRKLARRNGVKSVTSPDQVLVTNGGMHALYCTYQALLNQGDEVIVPQPNWTPSGWMIRLAGGVLRPVPLEASAGFDWDVQRLADAVTPRTRAILVNSPHNPTGGVLSDRTITSLLALAERKNLYVIADEAYEDIYYTQTAPSSIAARAEQMGPQLADQVVSCFTFSKSYAMTGWRLGYVCSPNQQVTDQIKKLILYSINGVATPVQYAGVAALDGPQDCVALMRNEYRLRRDLLLEGVAQCSLLKPPIAPGGAFYLYCGVTDEWDGTASQLADLLIESYGLGCIPSQLFGDPAPGIRFSYACDTDMIRRALSVLHSVQPKPLELR